MKEIWNQIIECWRVVAWRKKPTLLGRAITRTLKESIFQLEQKASWEVFLISLSIFAFAFFIFHVCFLLIKGGEYSAVIGDHGTRTLILFLAGTVGWYFLLRRTRVNEKSVSIEQLTRSMEHLANDKSSIQLGGVLGLKNIAKVQEEERNNIIRIFITRIHELTAKKDQKENLLEQDKRRIIEATVIAISEIAEYLWSPSKLVICDFEKIDLSNLNFVGLDFSYSQFALAKFQNTYLGQMRFHSANLDAADFNNARVEMSIFNNTFLANANFTDAEVVTSNFTDAHLTGAVFKNTNISLSIFKNVKGLTQEQLDEAYYVKGEPPSDLPEGLKLPPEKIR